ncbi:threonine aldolase family protein [Saccharicrinis sp. FJH54]|uniref:threonine aldolase family protein n=1 Tax=Saccharicrinis sp. FJH54 TaxID=3344665 RepID=UPI0035D41F05
MIKPIEPKRGFASDNNAGVHPQILKALETVNQGHVVGYGDDPVTEAATAKIREIFKTDCEVFFVFNGTGANIVSLQSATHSFESVYCTSTAHIHVDECGAPEKFTGSKIVAIETPDGKLTPELIKPHLHGFGFEHHSQPRVISITQSTEMGTVYKPDEIRAITKLAHDHNMVVHMDGARIANAAIALNMDFHEFTVDCGIDILSFGGTKNGMMIGEAIIIFNKELSYFTKYYRKQGAQLYSKMRFVSAQFLAYFEDDLWIKSAKHANKMAQRLFEKVKDTNGVKITQKVESNGVFAIIPKAVTKPLMDAYFFYYWNENTNEVRWMTAFDTTEEDIDGFVKKLKELCDNAGY